MVQVFAAIGAAITGMVNYLSTYITQVYGFYFVFWRFLMPTVAHLHGGQGADGHPPPWSRTKCADQAGDGLGPLAPEASAPCAFAGPRRRAWCGGGPKGRAAPSRDPAGRLERAAGVPGICPTCPTWCPTQRQPRAWRVAG